jgi:glucose/arabinose dehydrogenase
MRLTRFLMLTLVSLFTLQTAVAEVPLNKLTPAEQRSGWQLLFDGTSTKGWRNFQKDKVSPGWEIKDGAIVRSNRGAGDIMTNEQYEYFELSLDYNISKGGNSGIMFHVTEEESTPWRTGPELQVQDNVDGHDPQKSGWLYQLYKPLKPGWVKRVEGQAGIESPDIVDATRPAGQWNNIYLRIHPNGCEVCLNGVSYFKFKKGDAEWDKRVAASKFAKFPKFGKATKGHICLQDHGNLVSYRNVKVRVLPADGKLPEPIDGNLNVGVEPAFPNLKWADWEGIDEKGKQHALRPIVLTHANDNSNRLFVAAQRGRIFVFDNNQEVKESKVFLDIEKQVQDWRSGNEEGMLGMAFHPKYKDNGQFFVYYTAKDNHTSIVSRFTVSKDDANKADPASETVIWKLKQPFGNHNGGSIAFGQDGYLYIALGDGGSRNDPFRNGQNLETQLGSILRIDVDKKDGDQQYGIPSDNPFVSGKAQPEIFAYGFRNIWRLSFDSKTGDLWAADVGQDLWEEINLVTKGGNYGWSIREGAYPFKDLNNPAADPIEPVWEYDHQLGKSITGGHVYRGKRVPELQGRYLYADFVTAKIWALNYDKKAGKTTANHAVESGKMPVLAFGEDASGEVYYFIESVTGKSIYRFKAK